MSIYEPDTGRENLWSAFVANAGRNADRDAILQGESRATFGDLHRRADVYRVWLLEQGLRPGERVLVRVAASSETAAAIAGIWGARGIAILMDAEERAPALDHAIQCASPRLVLQPDGAESISLGSEIGVYSGDVIAIVPTNPETDEQVDGLAAASILFTSGSTGPPKGVTQSHGSLYRACHAVAGIFEYDATDRILCGIPWSFDYGYGQLLTTLLCGIPQVLPSTPGPAALSEAMERHRPTVLPGIPSLLTYLLRGPTRFRETDLSSLRIVTNTGGRLPDPILADLRELLPNCQIFMNYGLTESYRTSCLDPMWLDERPGSIGKAVRGVKVGIVKSNGDLAAPGEEGEIVHCGDYLFLGYWDDPAATARALRANPFDDDSEAARALFTGDLGFMDEDGFIYFRGRRDHQIKSMGVRVNPSSIEDALHASGLIRDAVVFARDNDLLGQEIWAAVVGTGSDPKLKQKLAAFANREMSRYARPRRYLVKDELPRTANGKVDLMSLMEEADQLPSVSLVP